MPVTEMGTPSEVYTDGLSTLRVIVFNVILYKKENRHRIIRNIHKKIV